MCRLQPEVDVRSLDELMRTLDVEPYGVPVGKVVDAYPSASRDIEVRCRCTSSPTMHSHRTHKSNSIVACA